MITFSRTVIPFFLLFSSACNNGATDSKKNNTTNVDSTIKKPSKAIVLTEFTTKLQNADKVLLVSHEFMVGIRPPKNEDELPEKNPPPPVSYNIVFNGKPNKAIIRVTSILTPAAITNLINILSKPPGDNTMGTARCYEPHNAILMENGGSITSYLDICFTCYGMRSSADIPFSEEDFDQPKWDALYEFVKQQGLTYKLQH